MIETTSTPAAVLWDSGAGHTIEIDAKTLEDIRRSAVDGLNSFAHGGLEVGGVLYGFRDGEHVTVTAFAELPCDHARGPGFVLSESDVSALRNLLDPPPEMETVGWYRSHTRRDLQLDPHDRELFEREFPEGGAIALIVKPTQWGPAAGAFFIRDAAGSIVPEAPRDFLITPPNRNSAESEKPPLPDREVDPLADRRPVSSETYSRQPDLVNDPNHRHGSRWLLFGAVAIIAAAALFWWFRRPENSQLRVYAIAPGQIRIEWNRRSRPVMDASSGVLHIGDGEFSTDIPLDSERIRSSSFTYTQRTPVISVRLQLTPGRDTPPSEESIEFVGPPATLVAMQPPLPRIEPTVLVEVEPTVRMQVEPPARMQPEPASELPPRTTKQSSTSQPTSLSLSKAPLLLSRPAAIASASAAPVPLPSAPAVSALAPAAIPDFLSRAPLHSGAPPAQRPPTPTHQGPTTGRLIWTGELGRRGVVEIDGAHASIGALAGALPGVPVSVHVAPAEFSRDGLIAYSNDAQKKGHTEPASKSTGWNSLRFQIEPARAAELVLLEAPNSSNGFTRLVLRNLGRACSVILVDWEVKPSDAQARVQN